MKVLRNELEILYVAVVFIVHTIASKNYYLSIIQLHIDHYFNTKPIKKYSFYIKKENKDNIHIIMYIYIEFCTLLVT